jgi:hypothetical protein
MSRPGIRLHPMIERFMIVRIMVGGRMTGPVVAVVVAPVPVSVNMPMNMLRLADRDLKRVRGRALHHVMVARPAPTHGRRGHALQGHGENHQPDQQDAQHSSHAAHCNEAG